MTIMVVFVATRESDPSILPKRTLDWVSLRDISRHIHILRNDMWPWLILGGIGGYLFIRYEADQTGKALGTSVASQIKGPVTMGYARVGATHTLQRPTPSPSTR